MKARFRRVSLPAGFGISFLGGLLSRSEPRGEDEPLPVAIGSQFSVQQDNSIGKSECRTLVGPSAWNSLEQPLDGQRARLSSFNNSLDDVRRQIAEPQQATDMGTIECQSAAKFWTPIPRLRGSYLHA